MSPVKKTLFTVSLGCDKNLSDTEVMLGLADSVGWELTDDPLSATAILINTCSFILDAKEESIESILEMAQMKEAGSCKTLIVAGCLPQRYGKDLADEMPEIDYIVGTSDLDSITNALNETAQKISVSQKPTFLPSSESKRVRVTPAYTANVKISEGCSSGCSFCIIPRLRGHHRSRPISDIITEVESLQGSGVSEICLIGQDLTAYGSDLAGDINLGKLICQPIFSTDKYWTRLHYLYPAKVTDELIHAIKKSSGILPYFDIPIQHVDSGVLKIMNRKDDENSTREVIENIRKQIPDAVLRTSVMVGHPGETDEAFQRLADFISEGHFDHLGVFTYSQEEGTASANHANQIDPSVAIERAEIISSLQSEISRGKLEALVGKVVQVLIEGESEESELLTVGRMWSQARGIDGVCYISDGVVPAGKIVPVRIEESHEHDVVGVSLAKEK